MRVTFSASPAFSLMQRLTSFGAPSLSQPNFLSSRKQSDKISIRQTTPQEKFCSIETTLKNELSLFTEHIHIQNALVGRHRNVFRSKNMATTLDVQFMPHADLHQQAAMSEGAGQSAPLRRSMPHSQSAMTIRPMLNEVRREPVSNHSATSPGHTRGCPLHSRKLPFVAAIPDGGFVPGAAGHRRRDRCRPSSSRSPIGA